MKLEDIEKKKRLIEKLLIKEFEEDVYIFVRFKKHFSLSEFSNIDTTIFAVNENNFTFRYFQRDRAYLVDEVWNDNNNGYIQFATNELTHSKYWSKKYSVEDIIGYEIVDNSQIIERKTSNFGKIVAGGLLFGGVGAIAGSFDKGGSTKTKYKNDIRVRLILNDINNATFEMKCDSQETAFKLLYTLKLLEEKYRKTMLIEEVNKLINIENDLDEKIDFKRDSIINQIEELKNLLDQEIITPEEFQDLKSRVINK